MNTDTLEKYNKKVKSQNKNLQCKKIRHCIGETIRQKRHELNLTIEELSEILDIAAGFLGLIERGQRGTSVQNLLRIAGFFSISLDELTGFKKSDSSNDNELNEDEICIKSIMSILKSFDSDELQYTLFIVKSYVMKMKNRSISKSYIDLQED